MIRISGGDLRGRRLEVPRGVRPTTELARKAAFDILGDAVLGSRVLDAAAGSGAYGLEALPRGARAAVFVEADRRNAKVLEENAARLGLGGRVRVVGATVSAYAARSRDAERFDVVFYDPPYAAEVNRSGFASAAAEGTVDYEADIAGLRALLSPGGTLFVERGGDGGTPATEPLPDETRRYGRTRLHIYRV